MVCPNCGTDTPHPATVCETCRTPFPALSAPTSESETVAYGTGPMRTPGRAGGAGATGPLAAGAPFGARYRILRELGAGGMGVVYQAWDAELGVPIALKVVRPEVNADPQVAQEVERRFKRELLLARQVTHKHVVRIHDLGEIDGIKYITMPYIEGRDLAQVLRDRGQLPAPEALKFAKQIAAGLVAAHDAGVVHRDLKPENIMIDQDGQALIMDFGISRSVTAGTATATGAVMGTLEYMAPEQARGSSVDHRADLYSFGLIVHDMLVGRHRVSTAQSAMSEMMGRMQQPPPPLRTFAPEAPEALERIVAKCLQPDPERRYATTRALVDALESLDADGRPARLPVAKDRQWKAATATMLVLVLLSAGAAVWFAKHRGAPAPPAAREPVSVLIADFRNGTGESVFQGSLELALGIAIEGAPFITSFPRLDAQKAIARQKPGATLNEEGAHLLAASQGIDIILLGNIAKAGGEAYDLTVRAVDPRTDKIIATERARASNKGGVLQAVGELAAGIRTDLGDSPPKDAARAAAAETFTAGSLEAMRAYARGQELNYAGRQTDALKAYQDAVALDPGLARAYAGMGVIYGALKQDAKVEESYQNAFKHLDRMSEREKLRTQGGYYLLVTHNYEKAIENYEALVRHFPADDTGHANLAYAYLNVRDVPKAVEEGRKAIEIYPRNTLQRTNYAMYLMYAGDYANAIAESKTVLEANPSFEYALLTVANSQLGAGDIEGSRQTWARLAAASALGASMASLGRGDLAMHLGRHREAITILTDGIKADEARGSLGEAAAKYVALAEAHQSMGNRPAAAAAARKAASLRPHESVLFPAAVVLTDSGDITAAKELATKLDNMLQSQTRSYAKLILGNVALKEKRLGDALDALRDGQKRHDSWFAHLLLGRAYLDAGRFAEAVAEFEACVKRKGEASDVFFENLSTSRYLPPVYYWLGRAQEGLGAATAAKASYEQFVKLRAESDPADPLAADAAHRMVK
jgi:eukaryotic-like serine/threonine-protein kinase